MQIRFDCIPVDIPSKKTGRIYPLAILNDIANQINTSPQEILIINHVGDWQDVDYSRACGSVTRGSASVIDGILKMTANFLNKDFFLSHPFEFVPCLKNVDLSSGNMMEKFTQLDLIEYSPIGIGNVDSKKVITEYKITYICGQPKSSS